MKKIWILLMFLTAALFASCSDASAGPLDGTWTIESGKYKADYGGKWEGRLISFTPREFELRIASIQSNSGTTYEARFNNGAAVELQWEYTVRPSGKERYGKDFITTIRYLERRSLSGREYRAEYDEEDNNGDDVTIYRNIKLVDDNTIKLIMRDTGVSYEFENELILKRADQSEGGGCNAGLGVLVSALLFPAVAVKAARRKSSK